MKLSPNCVESEIWYLTEAILSPSIITKFGLSVKLAEIWVSSSIPTTNISALSPCFVGESVTAELSELTLENVKPSFGVAKTFTFTPESVLAVFSVIS